MILEDGGWIYEIDTLDNENQRFDHFGCVKQIKYGNREFLSEEKTPILYQNKGVGICSEFLHFRQSDSMRLGKEIGL